MCLAKQTHSIRTIMEMPLPPASRTDRAAVEATAFSETLGAELLVFPGARERRHVGAVQRRTVEKLPAAHVGLVGSVGETCAEE